MAETCCDFGPASPGFFPSYDIHVRSGAPSAIGLQRGGVAGRSKRRRANPTTSHCSEIPIAPPQSIMCDASNSGRVSALNAGPKQPFREERLAAGTGNLGHAQHAAHLVEDTPRAPDLVAERARKHLGNCHPSVQPLDRRRRHGRAGHRQRPLTQRRRRPVQAPRAAVRSGGRRHATDRCTKRRVGPLTPRGQHQKLSLPWRIQSRRAAGARKVERLQVMEQTPRGVPGPGVGIGARVATNALEQQQQPDEIQRTSRRAAADAQGEKRLCRTAAPPHRNKEWCDARTSRRAPSFTALDPCESSPPMR